MGKWGRAGLYGLVILCSVWGWWLLLVERVGAENQGAIRCPACGRSYRWDRVSHAFLDSRGFGAARVPGKHGKETICACGHCLGDYDAETGLPYPDFSRRAEHFCPAKRYDQ